MLREGGIETTSSEEEGCDAYVAMRTCWNQYIVNLASYMEWRMEEIDTAMPR